MPFITWATFNEKCITVVKKNYNRSRQIDNEPNNRELVDDLQTCMAEIEFLLKGRSWELDTGLSSLTVSLSKKKFGFKQKKIQASDEQDLTGFEDQLENH
jgi:hypothetical protein